MKRKVESWHSEHLGKDMNIVHYGEQGFPLLLFPTAAADFLEYERFLMLEAIAEPILSGKVQVFSINSINAESWLNQQVHPKFKALRQEQYNNYVCQEVVPYIRERARDGELITAGASLGAFHAANQLLRRPDLFDGMIAMSGVYDIRKYYDSQGYHDELIYLNNPLEFLPNLQDQTYLPLLQAKSKIFVLTGQGPYESPQASRNLSAVLSAKRIPHELDLWGFDMSHDWPTWRAMMEYYLQAHF